MKSPACSRACCGNEAASRQRRETAIESCSPACCGPCRQASRTRSAPCKPAGRLPGAVAGRASPPGDFPEPLHAVQARRATSRSRCRPCKPVGQLPGAVARRASPSGDFPKPPHAVQTGVGNPCGTGLSATITSFITLYGIPLPRTLLRLQGSSHPTSCRRGLKERMVCRSHTFPARTGSTTAPPSSRRASIGTPKVPNLYVASKRQRDC